MVYISHYRSPIGDMLLAADEIGLTGLWFEGQKYFARQLEEKQEEREIPLFEKVKQWLGFYGSASFCRHSLSEGGMGNSLYHSLRPDDDLR